MTQEQGAAQTVSAEQLITICHDLRQYIAAGLLLSHMPGDEELDDVIHRRLDMLHDQFAGASDLLTSTAENLAPRSREVDLVSLVEECVGIIRLTHPVSVESDAHGHVKAYGDPTLLRRAVNNLLDNACRAVERTGRVVARTGQSNTESWVEIIDDGDGFGQIPSGSGRGLSVVNSAVRASNGRLSISSGPGPGTVVRMCLPRPAGHHS